MRGRIKYGLDGERRFFVNDREVGQEEFDEAFPPKKIEGGVPGGHLPSCWPKRSFALGIHPRNHRKAVELAKSRGVPTEFVPCDDGNMMDAVFRDRAHRKAYCKAFGIRDRSGGYGDA